MPPMMSITIKIVTKDPSEPGAVAQSDSNRNRDDAEDQIEDAEDENCHATDVRCKARCAAKKKQEEGTQEGENPRNDGEDHDHCDGSRTADHVRDRLGHVDASFGWGSRHRCAK